VLESQYAGETIAAPGEFFSIALQRPEFFQLEKASKALFE